MAITYRVPGDEVQVGVITDAMWARMAPIFPAEKARRGRPWRDHRDVLEAIAWRFDTGASWRHVRAWGPWQTVWARHQRWLADGTYHRLYQLFANDHEASARLGWLRLADRTLVDASLDS